MINRTLRDSGRSASDDGGFTLIELVVVVLIMPVIMGAIAFGLVAVFHLQSSVTHRLSGSGDLQKVYATYIKDVESAESVTTQSSPLICGTSLPTSTYTQLLGLVWSSGATAVSYVTVPMNNDYSSTSNYNFILERLSCTLGNMKDPSSTNVISQDVSATQGPPSICATNFSTCSATPVAVESASNIAAIKFSVNVPDGTPPFNVSGYQMVASPRPGGVLTGGSPSGPFATPGLYLFGTGCPVLTVGSANQSNPEGIYINSNGGTGNGMLGIASPCPGSIIVSNTGNIYAQAILTPNPNLNSVSFGANPGNIPPQYGWTPPPDPLANIAPPLAPSSTSTGKCSQPNGKKSTLTCTPGYYATMPNIASNSTVIFSAGNYYFASDFTLPNKVTATFQAGAYTFGAADAGAFNSGNSNTIFGYGAMFYAPKGSIQFLNGTGVSMSPATSWTCDPTDPRCPSGTQQSFGVSLWVASTWNQSTGVGQLALSNNSASSNTGASYAGIYVPNGDVATSANGTINISYFLANTANFANGLVVNITANSPS